MLSEEVAERTAQQLDRRITWARTKTFAARDPQTFWTVRHRTTFTDGSRAQARSTPYSRACRIRPMKVQQELRRENCGGAVTVIVRRNFDQIDTDDTARCLARIARTSSTS